MCQFCDEERQRLTEIADANPMPCVVCDDKNVVSVGTWIPGEENRLAAGATDRNEPIFSFCLCRIHAEQTEENEKIIAQAILRDVRLGKGFKV